MPENGHPPNQGMEPTPLRVNKIRAILKLGIGPSAFPIYRCAAAEAQAVGRLEHLLPDK